MTDHGFEYKDTDCLSDETLTLWSQDLLPPKDQAMVEIHIKGCALCRNLLVTLSDVKSSEMYPQEFFALPSLNASVRRMIKQSWENKIGAILLKISNGVYGAVQTTGRVIFAPWLQDGVVVRADSSDDLSCVVIETNYRDMRCVIESIRTLKNRHTLKAVFCMADNGRPIDRALCVLYQSEEEIESQMSAQGVVVFEDLPMGLYRLMITFPDGLVGYFDFHLIAS